MRRAVHVAGLVATIVLAAGCATNRYAVPIASFHDVDDACREHGIDRDGFLAALRGVA